MKKVMITSAAALSVILGSTAAIAGGPDDMGQPSAHTGFYAGADVGYGAFSNSDQISAIKQAAKDAGVSMTDSGVVFGAHVGYDINRYFALQTTYMYLPRIKFTFNSASSSVYSNMIALEAKGMYPVMNDKLIPFATAGYGIIINSASGDDTSSSTEWEPVVGLGLEYKVTPSFGVNAQYKVVINANNDFDTVNMGLVGFNYYF